MKTKSTYIITGIVATGILGLFTFAVIDKWHTDAVYHTLFHRYYKVISPEMPQKMDFAGEQVPLNLFYVRESLERDILVNTFYHSSTIMMFKRAYRWFPVIEPILKKNGIPDDFKFLALAESNFTNAVSPSGAEGFWQFLKPTGVKYGLEINDEVDERYNVEKATEAACHYFQDAFEEYKNWTLVAASFNRGLDGVSKAIEKQRVNNYYDLYLVDETARYIFRILAMKEIWYHPVQYGYYLRERDFYPPILTYKLSIDSSINDLPAFARNIKINYRILREFNQWLKRYNLPNRSNKTYILTIPKEGDLQYETLLKRMPPSTYYFHDTLDINDLH